MTVIPLPLFYNRIEGPCCRSVASDQMRPIYPYVPVPSEGLEGETRGGEAVRSGRLQGGGGRDPFFAGSPSDIGRPFKIAPILVFRTGGPYLRKNFPAISEYGGLMRFTSENAREYALRSCSNAKERRAKGVKTQKERKKMKEELKTLLKISLNRGDIINADDVLSLDEAEKANITVQTAMNIAMIKRAINGDVNAYLAVRDTVGEKPTDKVEIDTNLTVEEWAKNHKVKL